MKARAAAVVVLLPALLAGCASLGLPPVGRGNHEAGEAAQRIRAEALGLAGGDCAAPPWALSGRVALSNGTRGGSGRIEWSQGAGSTHMQLSAPVTRQSWILDVAGDGATLQGVADAPLRDADAARLLRETTGWDIPVAALGCWLRAAAAGPGRFGPALVDYDANLLPRQIEQDGWTIEYDDWAADPASGLSMPARIEARRGNNRVRLVVDHWGRE